jgi:hypothetical protein
MVNIVKKIVGLAKSSKDKKVNIKIEFKGKIDNDDFKIAKNLFSFKEAVLYLNNLQKELSNFKKIEGLEITNDLKDKHRVLFSFFTVDDKILIEKDGKVYHKPILQNIYFTDNKKHNFEFKDIDKNIGKYTNPFKIKKVIKESLKKD